MHIQSGQKLASTTSAECPLVVSDDYNNGLKFRLSMIARIIKADHNRIICQYRRGPKRITQIETLVVNSHCCAKTKFKGPFIQEKIRRKHPL